MASCIEQVINDVRGQSKGKNRYMDSKTWWRNAKVQMDIDEKKTLFNKGRK